MGGKGRQRRNSFHEDVPLVEFVYLVFTRMPGESELPQAIRLCCCVRVSECDILQMVTV